MADGSVGPEQDLAAGEFSPWLVGMRGAIASERGSDVPCAGCTACCTSSQFVHIAPDETETLSRIPAELLFPSPGLPRGHVVLGYDERGHCPMLVDNRCSIYEHRPRTCRTYDCRVFPAAGVDVGDEKALIARQARRWRFQFSTEADTAAHEAVQAAATFLDEHRGRLADAVVPTDATQLAVLAIEVHDVFLSRDEDTGQATVVVPDPEVVRAEVMRRTGRRSPPPTVE